MRRCVGRALDGTTTILATNAVVGTSAVPFAAALGDKSSGMAAQRPMASSTRAVSASVDKG